MPDLPPIPPRLARLPRDRRGYPVPYFVAWIDGEPDFRVVAPGRINECHNKARCWLCGGPMGAYKAFVLGPMCVINRTASEPPSHRECAEFAVRACPFLTTPAARRRSSGLPEDRQDAAGVMLKRNPGVALLWITRGYEPFRVRNGVLFRPGEPTEVHWLAEGRQATREEVLASIESGMPLLRGPAEKEGPEALRELERWVEIGMRLIPVAAQAKAA